MYNRGGLILDIFHIFNKSTPEICYKASKSTHNSKKNFYPVTASSLVTTFWGVHYTGIRVQKFLFTVWTLWVSKDAEFYIDFKNINLH
jgi:hypothetical protein